MKNKFTFIFLLITMTQLAQSKAKFEGEKVKVSFDENINSKKISIKLAQGTWKVTIFPLFQNNQIVENTFPKEAGIYNLVINYSDDLYYSEIAFYKMEPNFEKLSFDFYQDSGRIFCRIKSDFAQELNKEIVLNKHSDEINEILKSVEK
jgi:hypothetical protein